MRLALALVLLSATASADTPELALGETQLTLAPVRDVTSGDDHTTPYVHTAGYVQLAEGNASGPGISSGASFALSGANYELVHASAQANLTPRADQQAEARASWNLCVFRAYLTLEFSGHRDVAIAPSIDARASLWRRRYDETYNSVTVGGGELGDSVDRHSFLLLTIGHGTTAQTDAADTRDIVDLEFTAIGYRFRYVSDVPVIVDVAVYQSNGTTADTTDLGAVTSSFEPLHVTFDAGSVFGNLRAGWGYSGGWIHQQGETQVNGQTTSSYDETIDNAGLPELSRSIGELTLGARFRGCEASGTASRALFPTFDGDLAYDERISGRLGFTHGKTALSLSSFAAQSQTWKRDALTTRTPSVGAGMAVSRSLTSLLRLDAIGQVARSPYARLDGDREPTSTLGGQVLLALSAHVQR
ncbi:hypothetical protein BH11MYX2_BH11MYX2_29620 [soil metagenome]